MSIIFGVIALVCFLGAVSILRTAQSAVHEIEGFSLIGTAVVAMIGSTVDSWYRIISRRLRRLEKSSEALPQQIADEIIAALDGRYRPPSR